MRKDECQGCIGFDVPHTCEGWQEHQEILKHRHDCLKCGEKDKRIEELEAKLADALDRPEFVLHQMWQDAETKLAELEDNAVADKANIYALIIKGTELEAKLAEVKEIIGMHDGCRIDEQDAFDMICDALEDKP